ncbi:dienelactone hydrolase family protein [Pelomonas sp. SE-A7]|uniref:alpha/beta hydrolase n=1 Tax=Pelomonas sp. SE-A7 TaxID=3054953 RepID=UPI00259C9B20|nr:dienelactone hydrolase family protein [Pelomonas sp. SE-A7]MDM4766758.1 dienelactone hydrolase family protein [Pelomonas sp. SE-A7]
MNIELIELESGPEPTAAIIVLHGLGADGNDFVPICQELDLEAAGPVRYVFPSAPEMPVTLNGGYRMRAWYDIYGPWPQPREDEAGLRRSQAIVDALIAREIERGIPAERIVLMGFSQGCAMSLMSGLRQPNKLAGLVALSGYLPLAETVATERSEANADTPIFMAHGSADPVVVIERAHASRQQLEALGYAVEWHDYPVQHSVCLEEIRELNDWLLQRLPPVARA